MDINDDVNRLNTHIDQFDMVENKYRIKIKEIVNDNIKIVCQWFKKK